jgi:D-tyrosyl-tRNA(Tyr) deacylase
MIAVIQRVKTASVTVAEKKISNIGMGILALVGVGQEDTRDDAVYLATRMPVLRIFADEAGKMNRSLLDIQGEFLLVSQFTLMGDIYQGRRPSFTQAAPPDKAIELLAVLKSELEKQGIRVQEGQFGAMMDVALLNDGPVTFILDTKLRK